jgi:hypothetical protein
MSRARGLRRFGDDDAPPALSNRLVLALSAPPPLAIIGNKGRVGRTDRLGLSTSRLMSLLAVAATTTVVCAGRLSCARRPARQAARSPTPTGQDRARLESIIQTPAASRRQRVCNRPGSESPRCLATRSLVREVVVGDSAGTRCQPGRAWSAVDVFRGFASPSSVRRVVARRATKAGRRQPTA